MVVLSGTHSELMCTHNWHAWSENHVWYPVNQRTLRQPAHMACASHMVSPPSRGTNLAMQHTFSPCVSVARSSACTPQKRSHFTHVVEHDPMSLPSIGANHRRVKTPSPQRHCQNRPHRWRTMAQGCSHVPHDVPAWWHACSWGWISTTRRPISKIFGGFERME